MRASLGHRVAPSQVGVQPPPGEKPTSPFVQLANLHPPPLSAHLQSLPGKMSKVNWRFERRIFYFIAFFVSNELLLLSVSQASLVPNLCQPGHVVLQRGGCYQLQGKPAMRFLDKRNLRHEGQLTTLLCSPRPWAVVMRYSPLSKNVQYSSYREVHWTHYCRRGTFVGGPRTEMFWLSTDVGNEHSGFGDRLSTEKPFVSDRIEAGWGEERGVGMGVCWERKRARADGWLMESWRNFQKASNTLRESCQQHVAVSDKTRVCLYF